MDFSSLFYGFYKVASGFVKVVLCISRLLPNKTKLKFDQDFLLKLLLWIKGIEWAKVLNARGLLCLWRCLIKNTSINNIITILLCRAMYCIPCYDYWAVVAAGPDTASVTLRGIISPVLVASPPSSQTSSTPSIEFKTDSSKYAKMEWPNYFCRALYRALRYQTPSRELRWT